MSDETTQGLEDFVNLKAVVRYDGTGFAGWQIQPNQRTVQGEIEAALSRIASRAIRVSGAARTDSGVHAMGQVCSFRWPKDKPHNRLHRALCEILGPEIRMESLEEVAPDFHARFSAVSKRYAYSILLSRHADPFTVRYAWRLPWQVDLERAVELGQRLVGTHDFAGFQCSGASAKTTVRTLNSIALKRGGFMTPIDAQDLWRIEFFGNGFLYKMVRNVTCTLLEVARGRIPTERIDELLASTGPFRGHTAPPQGLVLLEVGY